MGLRIGIVGASGFVGSALCERLYFSGNRDFVPFVHSSGNAWRVSRLGVPLRTLDLRNESQVRAAVAQCDVIVNCALATDDVKSRGLASLARAAREARIRKFVHLSSIAIFGRDPAADSVSEAGRPDPGGNPYGILKLRQDKIIFDLERAGVPSYILVPGNIGGPYSLFMSALAQRLAAGTLPLVEEGSFASNIIHVDNLVEAILAAIRANGGSGERYFVNEIEPVPWRRVFDDVARLLDIPVSYTAVTRDAVVPLLNSEPGRLGIAGHARVILSGEFRAALSKLPLFRALNDGAAALFGKLPQRQQQRIRERLKWPVRVAQRSLAPPLDDRYVTVQARRFYHSTLKLQRNLGWQPVLGYQDGIASTCDWLRFAKVVPPRGER